MFTIYILVILFNFGVLSSSQHRHNRAAKVQCKESIKTVVEVRTCPKDKEAWDERARMKGCGNVPHNCSDTQLSYHCVLNELGHGLVEVCAMSTEIIGRRCAEFTPGGMFIQEHYENSCRSCPFAYNSSMGYLYDECFGFAAFEFTSDGHTTQHQTEEGFTDMVISTEKYFSTSQKNIKTVPALAISLGVIVPFVCIGFLGLICGCKKRVVHKGHKANKRISVDGSTGTPLMSIWRKEEHVTHVGSKDDGYFSSTALSRLKSREVEHSNDGTTMPYLINVNEGIEELTMRLSKHPDITNKTLQEPQEQLVNKIGHSCAFPKTQVVWKRFRRYSCPDANEFHQNRKTNTC